MNYTDMPVYQHKDRILSALEKNQVVVVESPTGSGKTTQLPVILLEAGYEKNGIIGVTQPRRIAALSVSAFIARQLGCSGPEDPKSPVGYKMRFEDRTGNNTKIKIMTDGILLQEMKLDPWLSRYGVMIIDEAHERSLNIDFILGLLKRILEERKEFKVIVSSATINAQVFSEYFGECPVVKIDAQTFPVTLIYDPPLIENKGGILPAEALLIKIENIVQRIINEKRQGDILVFLPGEKMIKDCMNRLVFSTIGKDLHVIPLYGRLGKEEQERVFEDPPRGKTKTVISTNIAETSVTIDGITAVLDSGLSKLNSYNPRTFTSSLIESPISRASANQRKGRAGRTREGSCYRLYTRKDFESRPFFTTEEIYRTDLSEVVLRMADLGITDYEEFDFISPPGREGILAAVETLKLLNALEEDRTLSSTGKMMTEFPLSPRHSRIIVEALLRYPNVIEETVIAAAFLSTQSPYLLPPGEEMDARKAHHRFRDSSGDFISYLKLYRLYMDAADKKAFCENNYLDERAMAEINNVSQQLEEIISDMQIPILSGGSIKDYLCCIGRGLIQFICVRENKPRGGMETYRSLTADKIMIHPGSVMFKRIGDAPSPHYIVAGEIIRTTKMYAMAVSPLSIDIISRISPQLTNELEELTGKPVQNLNTKKQDFTRRDFTNKIRIGTEIFTIETIKGKKHVLLPWEKLIILKNPGKDSVKETFFDSNQYRGMRGIISYKNHTLMAGERLSLILKLLPALDLEQAFVRQWKRKTSFFPAETKSLMELINELPVILKPAVYNKKKSAIKKNTANNKAPELGFIALFTGGRGSYWFRCSRSIHTALNESMASFEALIDELGEDIDITAKHEVNQAYRRLADLLTE